MKIFKFAIGAPKYTNNSLTMLVLPVIRPIKYKAKNIRTIKANVAIIIFLNNLTIFDSIADAGRKLNVHTSRVSAVCKNKLNHVGGDRFMYLEDYEKNIK